MMVLPNKQNLYIKKRMYKRMIMENTQNSGIITQVLEVPKRESKEGVFTSFLELRVTAARVMERDTYNQTDERVNNIIDWMISGIPNRKVQEDLRKEIRETIKEQTKDIVDNKDRGRRIQEIYRDLAGKIAPYMDLYTGGERVNRLSMIIPIKEMRELMEKYNPEHFEEHFKDEVKI